MFYGLEGLINLYYVNDMMVFLIKVGWQVVLMYFRGCSGEINQVFRVYYLGEISDLVFILLLLNECYFVLLKVVMGFFFGVNMLFKLLGENFQVLGLKVVIVILVLLKLDECVVSVNQGFFKVYQKYLLNSMKYNLLQKM